MMIETFLSLFYAGFLFLFFFSLGHFLLKRFLKSGFEELDRIIFFSAGMAMTGYALIALASFHALNLTAISLFFIFTAPPLFFSTLRKVSISQLKGSRLPPGIFSGPLLQKVLMGVFALTVVLTFAVCFLPEIGHDALSYHINLAKIFSLRGNFDPISYDMKSFRTLFMPCLYTLGIFFKSVTLAKLMHWISGILLCFFLAFWLKRKSVSAVVSWLMALMLLLTPTLFNQFTTTYTDAASTLFCFTAFYLFLRAREKTGMALYLISGLLMGTAIGSKLLTAMVPLSMGLVSLIQCVRSKEEDRRQIFQGLLLFSLGIGISCSYWFLRNYLFTGNPLYPFFSRWLGGMPGEANAENTFILSMGLPKTFLNYLLIPLNTVIYPDPFDRHHWIGPFYLFMLPFAVRGALQDRRQAGFALSCCWIVVSLWFYMSQNVRYLLPVFPLYLFSAGIGLSSFLNSSPRLILKRAVLAGIVLNLVLLFAVGCRHYRVHFQALLRGWDSAAYLQRLERTYPAALWVNRHLPRDAKIFSAEEVRQFYFDREMVVAEALFDKDAISPEILPEQLADHLKRRGFTHVLRTRNVSTQDAPSSAEADALMGVLDKALKSETNLFTFMTSIPSQNIREDRYVYDIYSLNRISEPAPSPFKTND